MEVIVLDGGRYSSDNELGAKLRKTRSKRLQCFDLIAVEWEVTAD